ncbi:MAG TPA: hypothetical protein VGH99_03720 [Pseudonocardia sp.]
MAVSYGWLGERPTPVELCGGLVSIVGVLLIRGVRGTRHHHIVH